MSCKYKWKHDNIPAHKHGYVICARNVEPSDFATQRAPYRQCISLLVSRTLQIQSLSFGNCLYKLLKHGAARDLLVQLLPVCRDLGTSPFRDPKTPNPSLEMAS